MGQSKGQAASLEQQLRRMQARQPQPPKAPQAPQKGLPRLERMDTSDSLTGMNTRNSFTTTEPLSTHPEDSTIRGKGRKTVAAVPPPPPPQKQVDTHAVKSLLDDLATTLKGVKPDGRTECFGFENFAPPRRHEVDDDFDAQMRDLHVNPSKKTIESWETQLRLWRGPVNKDASSTTLDLGRSTNVEMPRDVLLSAVRAMGEHVREHVREDHPHRKLTRRVLTDFLSVATNDRTEIYFVLDNPAKPTTLESSTMTRVNREAVRVLQALVHQCGGKVKQPPASKRRRRPRRRPKKDNSLKRALAKGRAADAARADGL